MIQLEQIGKVYNKDKVETVALKDINLRIDKGAFLSIVGTSGSGKTTLLNILGAMDHPTSGSYFFDDIEVSGLGSRAFHAFRKEKISFVFQNFELMSEHTVYDNVEMPLLARGEKHRREKVMDCLKRLHIEELAKKKPSHLSGGQQQRCAIARALVTGTDVILADEPTGALDQKTGHAILDVFDEIHESGKTIVLITHDENVAKRCGQIVRIEDGMLSGISKSNVL